VTTGKLATCVMPHDHRHVLGSYTWRSEGSGDAVAAAREAWKEWSVARGGEAAVFLKAASLLAARGGRSQRGDHARPEQERIPGEIDAACELVDFYRFNAKFTEGSTASSRP